MCAYVCVYVFANTYSHLLIGYIDTYISRYADMYNSKTITCVNVHKYVKIKQIFTKTRSHICELVVIQEVQSNVSPTLTITRKSKFVKTIH